MRARHDTTRQIGQAGMRMPSTTLPAVCMCGHHVSRQKLLAERRRRQTDQPIAMSAHRGLISHDFVVKNVAVCMSSTDCDVSSNSLTAADSMPCSSHAMPFTYMTAANWNRSS